MTESVVLYKGLQYSENCLFSPVRRREGWNTGWKKAVCYNKAEALVAAPFQHDSPAENCDCGFYGTLDFREARQYGNRVALVEFAGVVVIHQGGARGGLARIVGFVRDASQDIALAGCDIIGWPRYFSYAEADEAVRRSWINLGVDHPIQQIFGHEYRIDFNRNRRPGSSPNIGWGEP